MTKFSGPHWRRKTIIMSLKNIIANREYVDTKLLSHSINKLSSVWRMKRLTANEMIAPTQFRVYPSSFNKNFFCNGGLSSPIVTSSRKLFFLSPTIIFHRSNGRRKWIDKLGKLIRITTQHLFFL